MLLGGFITFLGIIAVVMLLGTMHPVLLGLAVFFLLAEAFTWISMIQHAGMIHSSRKFRGPDDFLYNSELDEIPDWIAHVNMVASAAIAILLITGVVTRFG